MIEIAYNAEMSQKIAAYLAEVEKGVETAYSCAREARKKGLDPHSDVEILVVKDMVERVVGLVSVVSPEIVGSSIPKRIKELEAKYGSLDWRVSLAIALEIAQEKFCRFQTRIKAIEAGIRVGFAYHTMGTVSSPLEGFVKLKIKKRQDGKEYIAISYAGPIRSAGGTGASVSVLIVDYVCRNFGYSPYDPMPNEVKRFSTELYDYHERITNLQYLPSPEEIEFMAANLPVEIDGDPSEKTEVSNYKDLPRIQTNTIRNGVCLVLGEGLCQKAEKLWKQLSQWGNDFGLGHWGFLKAFISLKKKIKSTGKGEQNGNWAGITPDYTYIKDLVAGRPVFSHPMRNGGFRLRYGRSRTSGFSSYSINPLTMLISDDYLAIGTQLKIERPGKSTTLTVCDTIEGPIVKFKDGSVRRMDEVQDLKAAIGEVSEILYMGDILINYGDFFNRAHRLAPPGYCEEWWILELEKAAVDTFGTIDVDKLASFTDVSKELLKRIFENPLSTRVSASDAFRISSKMNVPLHPRHTPHLLSIGRKEFIGLLKALSGANTLIEEGMIKKVVVPYNPEVKRSLELLAIPHLQVGKEFIVYEKGNAVVFHNLFIACKDEILEDMTRESSETGHLDAVARRTGIKLRDKNGIFIGCRMGRPEKAKMRKMTGSPHVLFPVGEEGGRLRSFQSALGIGKITADLPSYRCAKCQRDTIFRVCETCGKKTEKAFYCSICGKVPGESCSKHPDTPAAGYKLQKFEINEYMQAAMKKLKMSVLPDLIKGVRGTSNKNHVPENLMKGILRAKHGIYVNKDGTVRYDMTQLPITHFKPSEIGTTVNALRKMGYQKDMYGKELAEQNQVLELLPQDIILPNCFDNADDERAEDVLFNTANFIDDMLEHVYGLKRFYRLQTRKDIIGHLVIGLAPHISAAMVGRVIGFSKTQGFFAHPLFHAAMRRDCDGDEACFILLLDALINFSKEFLPAHRGSTQDAPLVITSRLLPSEVDDMVFDIDIVPKYPLEFYNACLGYKKPWDISIDRLGNHLHSERQYEGLRFTHSTSDINQGVKCSAYKILPTMEEKLKGQMVLAEKIRAVDKADVARLVIEKHFLKDIKGNIRKFSMQQFRCVKCNEKFRRPPLKGICTKCSGKIIFTISEGSVVKYLEPSISLAEKYSVEPYLQQSLMLTKRRVEMMFGKEREKQEGLGKWFG